MRIDCDGNVGIGTDSMSQKLDVRAADDGLDVVTLCNTATCGRGLSISAGSGNASHGLLSISNTSGGSILKFTGDGKLGVGTATPARILHVYANNDSQTIAITNDHAIGQGSLMSLASTPGTTYWFYRGDDSGIKFYIFNNGDMQNLNGNYGSISDVKLKQDITDARDYWDDFKQVPFRKFRFKQAVQDSGDEARCLFGVVAQEVESIFPGLVYETPDREEREIAVLDEDGNATYEPEADEDGNPIPITETKEVDIGTTTKGFKSSILHTIGMKVVQELQARVETLEAQLAAA